MHAGICISGRYGRPRSRMDSGKGAGNRHEAPARKRPRTHSPAQKRCHRGAPLIRSRIFRNRALPLCSTRATRRSSSLTRPAPCKEQIPARVSFFVFGTRPFLIGAWNNFCGGPSAGQLGAVCALQNRPQPLDAFLPTGFPIRVTLRSVLPVTKHLLLCFEDGSIVQRAEAKWQKADADLRSVLDAVREGIILFDSLGEIRLSNARFRELFGLASRDVDEAKNTDGLAELLSTRFRDPAAFAAPWRSYIEGTWQKPFHDELEMLRPIPRVLHRFSRPVLRLVMADPTAGLPHIRRKLRRSDRASSRYVGHTEKMHGSAWTTGFRDRS